MKVDVLKAIGHNLADSAACGMGFMIGLYEMDIFGEASASAEGYFEVDFLTGEVTGGQPSGHLARALRLYAEEALPRLCDSHGCSKPDFAELKARFWRTETGARRFTVTVMDRQGRRRTGDYEGLASRRVKVLDSLGRIRSK
jgi:hypothetical protein